MSEYDAIGPEIHPAEPPPNGSTPDLGATPIECCFLVIIDHNGGSQVILDIDQRFHATRAATAMDVYPAVANITADFQAMKTAEAVLNLQKQFAEQAAMQAQVEQIRRNLGTR